VFSSATESSRSESLGYANLAHAYLFLNRFADAKNAHAAKVGQQRFWVKGRVDHWAGVARFGVGLTPKSGIRGFYVEIDVTNDPRKEADWEHLGEEQILSRSGSSSFVARLRSLS
jgi:hypothetical protein